jgi:alpha-ribazole phosphatase
MQVYIVRHTKVSVEKSICYGQFDVDVASTFEEEKDAILSQLSLEFDAIFSSPLQRCTKLAKKLDSNFETDDRLMEMHFGAWEAKPWNDIPREELDPWMADFVYVKTPGGENLEMLFERTVDFLDELKTKPFENVLLVCHAGVIRCMWAYLLEIPLQNIFKIPVGFGEVFQFVLDKELANQVIKRKA